jgi:hypothetical protein
MNAWTNMPGVCLKDTFEIVPERESRPQETTPRPASDVRLSEPQRGQLRGFQPRNARGISGRLHGSGGLEPKSGGVRQGC